jgi:hypothetical protein
MRKHAFISTLEARRIEYISSSDTIAMSGLEGVYVFRVSLMHVEDEISTYNVIVKGAAS